MKKIFNSLFLIFLIFANFGLAAKDIQSPQELVKKAANYSNSADISFLVIDLKYNKKQGVKVCEIQNGSQSIFTGYDVFYGGSQVVAESFCNFLAKYQTDVWFIEGDIISDKFNQTFKAQGWQPAARMNELCQNQEFLEKASKPLYDPENIYDYHGVLYAFPRSIGSLEQFKNSYPSILVVDGATFPFFGNKYNMSTIFSDPRLKRFKPKWHIYPKEIAPKQLVKGISSEIGGKTFVIKPLGSALGNGVIIVAKNDLENTLHAIFQNTDSLNTLDPSYDYRKRAPYSHFIVEEFIESDPIKVHHLNNLQYDGTMRVICFLSRHKSSINIVFLRGFWKLPEKSINESGSLNDKHKTCLDPLFYATVTDDLRLIVENELLQAIPIIYMRMLGL